MRFADGLFYHVYNRGNGGLPIFFSEENYRFFLRKMESELCGQCYLLAYCLMPNHYHILIKIHENRPIESGKMDPLARKLGTLQSSYTRAINKARAKSGSLFQQKFKAKCLETEYQQMICLHYIHQNPIKARLIDKFHHWAFSSYPDYAGYRDEALPGKEIAKKYLHIPLDEMSFIQESQQVISEKDRTALFV